MNDERNRHRQQNAEHAELLVGSSADKYFANPSMMIDKIMKFLALQLFV
jgi:hypothetical protein